MMVQKEKLIESVPYKYLVRLNIAIILSLVSISAFYKSNLFLTILIIHITQIMKALNTLE